MIRWLEGLPTLQRFAFNNSTATETPRTHLVTHATTQRDMAPPVVREIDLTPQGHVSRIFYLAVYNLYVTFSW